MKRKFSLVKISKREAEAQKELYAPLHESDVDTSRKLKTGQRLVGSYSDADIRNLGHHKKLYALLNLTFHNLPHELEGMFKNVEELRKELLIQTGYREKRTSIGGQEYFVPRSMSFSEMGQAEFSELYGKFLDFICAYILGGVDSKELDNQIIGFM